MRLVLWCIYCSWVGRADAPIWIPQVINCINDLQRRSWSKDKYSASINLVKRGFYFHSFAFTYPCSPELQPGLLSYSRIVCLFLNNLFRCQYLLQLLNFQSSLNTVELTLEVKFRQRGFSQHQRSKFEFDLQCSLCGFPCSPSGWMGFLWLLLFPLTSLIGHCNFFWLGWNW